MLQVVIQNEGLQQIKRYFRFHGAKQRRETSTTYIENTFLHYTDMKK